MKILKDVSVTAKEIDKIFCNCCGREIKKNQFGYFEEYLSIEKKWGYGSDFDGEEHNIDICEDCYKNWIKGFSSRA